MSRFLFGILAGALLMFVAMHYHVVRGNQGVFLVPKLSNNLSNVYVDTRQFELDDWREHRNLAAAILQNDNEQLLEDNTLHSFHQSMRGLVAGFLNRG